MGSHKKQLIEEEEMGIFREEEGPSSSDSTNESEVREPTEKCESCIELEYEINVPCQCLQCDPDGTRYDCTCDEIYEHPQSRDTRDYVINTKA